MVSAAERTGIVAQHGHTDQVAQLAEMVEALNPGYGVSGGLWEGEAELCADTGGVAYTWLLDGRGEVWLERGYRTQEGDGASLPPAYRPDTLSPAARERLRALEGALREGAIHPSLSGPVAALCARLTDRGYQGDAAGDLWLLLESGIPPEAWTRHAGAREALAWLMRHHADLGWSAKDADGWESLLPGDQLITTGASPLRVRGRFRYWRIEDGGPPDDLPVRHPQCSAVRRLRHLRDTAGGCSPGFDAFRRLNLTWHPTAVQQARVLAALGVSEFVVGGLRSEVPISSPPTSHVEPRTDAPNRLNSHVLHIEAAQSRTHYHPPEPVGGGRPQSEFYFALDRTAYGLRVPTGAAPRLYTFPDVHDWRRHQTTELPVGTAVFIPPGVGHRSVDAFVNIVTIPGFKPGNEVYVDRLIRDQGRGAPYNEAAI
ncbi:MAG: hypothetical protein ACRDI2_03635 [Chloroflexota bacterium]